MKNVQCVGLGEMNVETALLYFINTVFRFTLDI